MATIVCVVGDKGGTGKSTWARALADLYRMLGLRAALFDGDWLARSLFKIFRAADAQGKALPLERQDPRRSCMPYDARDRRLGRDLLLNSMALPGAEVMLHDLPAGFRSDIAVLMGAANPQEAVREFAASAAMLNHKVIFINVFTPSPSDFHTAPWLAETLAGRADNARVVAVRNGLFDAEAFALWRGEPLRAFVAAGGIEIEMPRLDPTAAVLCDQRQLRFSKAPDDERMTLAERMRVASWLRRFADSLSPVAEMLRLPPDAAQQVAAALKFQPPGEGDGGEPAAPTTDQAATEQAPAEQAPAPENPAPQPSTPPAVEKTEEAKPGRKTPSPRQAKKEPEQQQPATAPDDRFLLPADLPVI